jgi:hypothetical protein
MAAAMAISPPVASSHGLKAAVAGCAPRSRPIT